MAEPVCDLCGKPYEPGSLQSGCWNGAKTAYYFGHHACVTAALGATEVATAQQDGRLPKPCGVCGQVRAQSRVTFEYSGTIYDGDEDCVVKALPAPVVRQAVRAGLLARVVLWEHLGDPPPGQQRAIPVLGG